MKLESKIESLLFWKGEPMTIKKIGETLGASEEEIVAALTSLEQSLSERGVRLMRKENEVTLTTAPEMSELIEKLTKEEITRDLGKAGLETLSIILYKGPIKRSEIDYIRGVNSNFILRNLLIRGLVEKVPAKDDQRSFEYKPTFELLSHLGVTKIEDLPEYATVKNELENFQKAQAESEDKKENSETNESAV